MLQLRCDLPIEQTEMKFSKSLCCVHLIEGAALPDLHALEPFKAVVIVEIETSGAWKSDVSAWLVASGCRYMMAWGTECSAWDDAVDDANLAKFDYEQIPDDAHVMTTWHENQPLSEVFWFAVHCAGAADPKLQSTVLVHIGQVDKSAEFAQAYAAIEAAGS
jgi:hypothetical protein